MISLSRRKFIAAATTAVGAGLLVKNTGSLAAPLGQTIGLALNTLESEFAQDLDGALRAAAQIGFRQVQIASTPSRIKPAVLKQAIDTAGLSCHTTHYFTPMLFANPQGAIERAQMFGSRYLICTTPWVADPSRRKKSDDPKQDFYELMQSLTLDDWKWNAEKLNKIGEQVKSAGLQFGYHNHGFDFKLVDGKIAFDELLRMTDPELVAIELDCGWAANAGHDPAEYLRRYPNRIQLLHIKDIKKTKPTTGFDMHSVEIGKGDIDWREVFTAAKAANIKGYFVEHEPPYEKPVMEMIKTSYDYLNQLSI